MSENSMSEDLRSIKTEQALYAAMFSLLKMYSFKKITIKRICEEAHISRAAFYAHFIDKYDLLKHWMSKLWPEDFDYTDPYAKMEKIVNHCILENMPILKNIVYEADDETFCILFDYIISAMGLTAEKDNEEDAYAKNIVLSSFYGGGIITYLLWQVKQKFPSDVPPMNQYLYKIILTLQDWQSKENCI